MSPGGLTLKDLSIRLELWRTVVPREILENPQRNLDLPQVGMPGLRYQGNVLIVDYEAVRGGAHLHWIPKVIHQKKTFLPPIENVEFPLARAARVALLEMADVDMVLKRDEYAKPLPYDICIDACPIEDRPPAPGHAYITSQRLEHGLTDGCPGCENGHSRHTAECRARFDAIYGLRTGAPPTPAALPPTPAGERASASGHPRDPMDDDLVPECPPASPDREDEEHGGELPAAVARQLPRTEVLSRPEALQAIRKEFDGVASMGTWDWSSVTEEADVKRRAIEKGETIHLADLLAICSEKHVELDPSFRQLKGRVCFRGDAAKTESGNIALYQTLSASWAWRKRHYMFWTYEGVQGDYSRCRQCLLASSFEVAACYTGTAAT